MYPKQVGHMLERPWTGINLREAQCPTSKLHSLSASCACPGLIDSKRKKVDRSHSLHWTHLLGYVHLVHHIFQRPASTRQARVATAAVQNTVSHRCYAGRILKEYKHCPADQLS